MSTVQTLSRAIGVIAACLIAAATLASEETLAWAKCAGGSFPDDCRGMAVLSDGSIVIVGSFEGGATFGSGEPNQTYLSAVSGTDAFVAVYAPDGMLRWAKRVGGSGMSIFHAVAALPDGSFVVEIGRAHV